MPSDMHPNPDISALIDRAAKANDAFMNGDPARSFALNPHAPDFSIMTPFGGFTTGGFNPAPDRIEAMARTFTSARTGFEVVATYGTDDMVVIAAVERQHGEVGGLPAQDWSLRVTLVYRRDGDGWQLAHRHADPLVGSITLDQIALIARG
jgi:Domain of unknown function (DUF4440)